MKQEEKGEFGASINIYFSKLSEQTLVSAFNPIYLQEFFKTINF